MLLSFFGGRVPGRYSPASPCHRFSPGEQATYSGNSGSITLPAAHGEPDVLVRHGPAMATSVRAPLLGSSIGMVFWETGLK